MPRERRRLATVRRADPEAYEAEFQRAVELNPNTAMAHSWYALYLLATGRNTAAVERMKRGQQLNLGWIFLVPAPR